MNTDNVITASLTSTEPLCPLCAPAMVKRVANAATLLAVHSGAVAAFQLVVGRET